MFIEVKNIRKRDKFNIKSSPMPVDFVRVSCCHTFSHFLISVAGNLRRRQWSIITYLLTYLLHGAESFLRS